MAIPTVHMILAGFLIQVAVTKIIWRNIYLPEKLHFGIFWLILIGLSLVVTFLTNIKTKNYKVYTFFLSLIVNFHGDYLGFYTVLSTMAQVSGDVKSTFDYETETMPLGGLFTTKATTDTSQESKTITYCTRYRLWHLLLF